MEQPLLSAEQVRILNDVRGNRQLILDRLKWTYTREDVERFQYLVELGFLRLEDSYFYNELSDAVESCHTHELTAKGLDYLLLLEEKALEQKITAELQENQQKIIEERERKRRRDDWLRTIVAAILGGGFVKIIEWLQQLAQ